MQRFVLIVAAVAVVIMLLFPPFQFQAGGTVLNLGYGFLFNPPRFGEATATVNASLLFVQWVAVLLTASLLWFALRDR